MAEKLDKFLERHKWKIKTLGEIATSMYKGYGVTREHLNTGDCPAVKCGDVNSGIPQQFYHCISFVNPLLIRRPRYFERGDVLVGALAHNFSSIGRASVYLGEGRGIAGNDVIVVKSRHNGKFLAHLLSSGLCRRQIRTASQGGIVVHLHLKEFKKIRVPLPPRHVQDLIVEVLDKWIELEKTIKEELEERKRQYEYLQNKIMTNLVDKCGVKTLSEISRKIIAGNGIIGSQIGSGEFPAIKNRDLIKLPRQFKRCRSFVDPTLIKNKKYCEHGDVVISNMGGRRDIGRNCVYLGVDKCIAGNHVVVVKHGENPKFMSYALSSPFCRNQMRRVAMGSTVLDIRMSELGKIEVPLPPMEEQNRICGVLDKFHEMTEELIPKLLDQVGREFRYCRESIFRMDLESLDY